MPTHWYADRHYLSIRKTVFAIALLVAAGSFSQQTLA
ncbi:MAG: hypothetical protein ACI9MU_004179, partial [Alphaproteobacteria bacterium]